MHLPPGTDPAAVDVVAAGSLPRAWSARWATDPGAVVLTGPGGDERTATALEAASARVARRLRGAGLAPGDRVLLSAATSLELVAAYVGALRAGLVVVPANTAYRQRELAHLVADAGPRVAVVDDGERAAWVAGADPSVVVVGPAVDLPDGPPVPLDQAGADDLAMLCYTSGTTGTPKGAVLTHGNLLAGAEAVRLAWRWDPSDHLVLCLPLFHLHGLGVGLNGTLLAGARATLQAGFDADAVLDAAPGATLLFGVPTTWARLARHPRVGALAGLRLCVSGSAPLPPEVHRAVEEGSGQRILERYGMTETIMVLSHPYDGDRRPGTVGAPLPGVEVRLGPGGEIEVRGPNVSPGYWGRPEASAEARTADGWFRSGDVGERQADGQWAIVGRAKELIISGGYNVYPREVEEVLAGHPGVAEVAVAGTPSPEWGEVVTAYVVVAEGVALDLDALADHAAAQLAPYKRPRAVHVVAELPRNALGKVLRHQLAPPA